MTRQKLGPWTIISVHTAFENNWIKVLDHKVVHPNGAKGDYGVVSFKNFAVGVLAIDDEGSVLMVGQHRFPHDPYSWELPEGGGPKGVAPLISAQRELEEETGVIARCWSGMTAFDISNSVTDEKAKCYYAWDLVAGKAAPDASEALTLKRAPFNAVLEMVIDGEISDSITIVMVLTAYVQALCGRAPAPISQHILASAKRT